MYSVTSERRARLFRPNGLRCEESSSRSKAARAPASRPKPGSWRTSSKSLGLRVLLTREPGGSPGAEIIRHVLLSGAAKPLGADAEAMLFAAAREDHVQLHHRAGACRRQMGGVRPLRRLHPRLSGRARPGRPAPDQGPRAGFHRRSHARPHARSRRAGRCGTGTPGAAPRRRSRPTGSKRKTSNFTKSCARRSARSPPPSRNVASSSMPACRASRSPKVFGTPCRPGSIRPPRRLRWKSRRRKLVS